MSIVFDYRRAVRIQRALAEKAFKSIENIGRIDLDKIKYVVGVDAAYHKGLMYGVAVLLDFSSGNVLEHSVVIKKPPIPYVPGLLAFREAPAYISAVLKLRHEPDIIFVDGHGLSHPRGLGIATHIGLVLDKPSIGVAKKKLYGEIREINGEKYLEAHGMIVARIIKHKGQELYISIGYKITLEDAYLLTTKLLTPKYKLPLPTAIADQLSKRIAHRKK
ncbi:Endonuclease V [Staphylothermus marinus F1]|uniref:Endonuclease V n=1 Tax=Staphylothermus marinus (strain ATCC 43588 / DSM 3639 / JCM 9404 / F1) TaxID=399550 RepID=A3DN20_STAMF|nr:endonuclease V [Staphylothermus marinus]ABN70030.1 Endonuclease V [Staphylothermus marinus F1]